MQARSLAHAAVSSRIAIAPRGNVQVATNGSVVWVVEQPGSFAAPGPALTTFADGSSVVSGTLEGRATFGAGELNEITIGEDASRSAHLARLNPDGSLAWVRRFAPT